MIIAPTSLFRGSALTPLRLLPHPVSSTGVGEAPSLFIGGWGSDLRGGADYQRVFESLAAIRADDGRVTGRTT